LESESLTLEEMVALSLAVDALVGIGSRGVPRDKEKLEGFAKVAASAAKEIRNAIAKVKPGGEQAAECHKALRVVEKYLCKANNILAEIRKESAS
jgi:signal transduction histidine kinase